MAERTSRIFAATKNQPRVIAGRMMPLQSSRPDGGTQPSFTAKKKIIIMPIQKGGADWPTSATTLPILSMIPPRLTDDRMPSGIPTMMEKAKAATPSWKVAIRRSQMMSAASRFSLMDLPKLPVSMSLRKIPYCS